MSPRSEKLAVSVYLSGDNLEMFKTLKKHHYVSTDAELLRMALRAFYERYLIEQAIIKKGGGIKKELGDELDKQVSK